MESKDYPLLDAICRYDKIRVVNSDFKFMSLFEIPQTVHYGLLFLTLLAEKRDGEVLSLAEASEKLGVVSIEYLEQIVMPLRQQGLIISQRGRNGGYSLTKKPEEITLGQVIEMLDGPVAIAACQKVGVTCPLSGYCQSQVLWDRMRERIWETLCDMTLADLAALPLPYACPLLVNNQVPS